MNTFRDELNFQIGNIGRSNWSHLYKLGQDSPSSSLPPSSILSLRSCLTSSPSANGELDVCYNPINNSQPLIGKPIRRETVFFSRFAGLLGWLSQTECIWCINYVNSLDTKCKLENDAEAFSENRLKLPSVPVFCAWVVQENVPPPCIRNYVFDIIQLYYYTDNIANRDYWGLRAGWII